MHGKSAPEQAGLSRFDWHVVPEQTRPHSQLDFRQSTEPMPELTES